MANEIQFGFNLSVNNGAFLDQLNLQKAITQNAIGKTSEVLSVAPPSAGQVLHGTNQKPSAACATTTTLPACTYSNGTLGVGATLTGNVNGALAAIDGHTPVVNEKVLVKNQAAGAQNGLYTLTTLGDGSNPYVLTRVTAMDETGEFVGASIYVEFGSTLAGTQWTCTNASAPTLGTTAITFGRSAPGTVIPFGSVTTSGLLFVQNLDATNYVNIGPEIGGVMMATAKLKAGEIGCIRVDPTTILRALANTATVLLYYTLYQD